MVNSTLYEGLTARIDAGRLLEDIQIYNLITARPEDNEKEIEKSRLLVKFINTASNATFEENVKIEEPVNYDDDENDSGEEDIQTNLLVYSFRHNSIRTFGGFINFKKSKEFLKDCIQLISEETIYDMVLWAINMEMRDEFTSTERITHQTMVLEFILKLMKTSSSLDPFDCVRTFFTKMTANDDQEYSKTLRKELRKLRRFVHDYARKKNDELVEKEWIRTKTFK
ncbi:hypothetical protein I4U23_004815 [Adineta vaga]|nr:hypothetical protein I4U23_004815 [Adineta vaga]